MPGDVQIYLHSAHLGANQYDDPLSLFLRALALKYSSSDDWSDKYGTNFENETFLMHQYCWCEKEDCRWCNEDACGCLFPPCEFFLDGKQIESWHEANSQILGDFSELRATEMTRRQTNEWDRAIAERNQRLKSVLPERTHTCDPKGMMADRPRGESSQPRQTAPNFWHKASGFKVWWYKYIGRSMEVHGQPDEEMIKLVGEEDVRRVIENAQATTAIFKSLLAQR